MRKEGYNWSYSWNYTGTPQGCR